MAQYTLNVDTRNSTINTELLQIIIPANYISSCSEVIQVMVSDMYEAVLCIPCYKTHLRASTITTPAAATIVLADAGASTFFTNTAHTIVRADACSSTFFTDSAFSVVFANLRSSAISTSDTVACVGIFGSQKVIDFRVYNLYYLFVSVSN